MFWFLIVGTRERVEARPGEAPQRRFCPRCGTQRPFLPARQRRYLTLFFLPILPLGAGHACLACSGCRLCIPEEAPYQKPESAAARGPGLLCPRCGAQVPEGEAGGFGSLRCPRCGGYFRLE